MIKKFLGKVKHVLDYAPLLWNEEDDNCDDFIKLIVFKAKRMKKCIAISIWLFTSLPDCSRCYKTV